MNSYARHLARRELLQIGAGITALGTIAGLLTACATNSALISAQALADAQGLVGVAQAIAAAIVQNDPMALSIPIQAQITAAENAATAAIASLTSSTAAIPGATTLQVIDSDLNTILAAVGAALPAAAVAFPVIAPFVPEYDAAVALLPAIETWVNGVLASATVTPPKASALAPLPAIKTAYTVAQARALLNVPVLK